MLLDHSFCLGLIKIQKSATNTKEGPLLFADVDLKNNKFNVKIAGYCHVLGISAEVDIVLTNTEFRFKVSGNLWNVFKASVELTATYGSLERLAFSVS